MQGTSAKITGLTSNEEYTISVAAMASDGRSGAALERLTCTRKEYLRACILNKFYIAMLSKSLWSSNTAAVLIISKLTLVESFKITERLFLFFLISFQ